MATGTVEFNPYTDTEYRTVFYAQDKVLTDTADLIAFSTFVHKPLTDTEVVISTHNSIVRSYEVYVDGVVVDGVVSATDEHIVQRMARTSTDSADTNVDLFINSVSPIGEAVSAFSVEFVNKTGGTVDVKVVLVCDYKA